MKTKKLLCFVAALSAMLTVFSVSKIILFQNEYRQSEQEYRQLREDAGASSLSDAKEETDVLSIDFDALLAINPDSVGWIDIPGTEVSYPVVQGEDNETYLRRSFAGRESVGGVLFLDYRSAGDFSGTNTVLYGHNMRDGSMFGGLKSYLDEDFLEEHAEIHVYTPNGLRRYAVFAAYEATTGWDCFTFSFHTDLERDIWLQSQLEHAQNAAVSLDVDDKVLTLVTCKGGENEYRIIVQAVCVSKERCDVD